MHPIRPKLIPTLLAIAAGLSSAASAHAQTSSHNAVVQDELNQTLERRVLKPFPASRKTYENADCVRQIENPISHGTVKPASYDCHLTYVNTVAVGMTSAPTAPPRPEFEAWASQMHKLRLQYPAYSPPLLDDGLDTAEHVTGPLYAAWRAEILGAYDALNPFGANLFLGVNPETQAARRARYEQLLPAGPALKAAAFAMPVFPGIPDYPLIHRLASDPAAAKVTFGDAAAPAEAVLLVDVASKRSQVALVEYMSLARAGKLKLTVLFAPLSPLTAAANAAVAESSTPFLALERTLDGEALTASETGTANLAKQGAVLRDAGRVVALPMVLVRKAGEPGNTGWTSYKGVQPVARSLAKTTGMPMSMSRLPINETLKEYGLKLTENMLSPIAYKVLVKTYAMDPVKGFAEVNGQFPHQAAWVDRCPGDGQECLKGPAEQKRFGLF